MKEYDMVPIVFGSTTGDTENAAKLIGSIIGDATVINVADAGIDVFNTDSLLILGTSTWGSGELQDDWEQGIELLKQVDLSGKKVALFGFGDQEVWGDTFLNGMRILYDAAVAQGAEIIGSWPVDGYEYTDSAAVIDGKFVGLALDENNQGDLTEERIRIWVETIRP